MPPQTQRGHDFPCSRQFSICLPNRIGQLRELLELLTDKKVHALGFSIVDSADWAVLRMVFPEPDRARHVLSEHRIAFTESEVILVEVEDQQRFTDLCEALLRAEIQIHFAYPLASAADQAPTMVIHVDDLVLARHVLGRNGFVLVCGRDRNEPRPDDEEE